VPVKGRQVLEISKATAELQRYDISFLTMILCHSFVWAADLRVFPLDDQRTLRGERKCPNRFCGSFETITSAGVIDGSGGQRFMHHLKGGEVARTHLTRRESTLSEYS
jgi:hypothetical protein